MSEKQQKQKRRLADYPQPMQDSITDPILYNLERLVNDREQLAFRRGYQMGQERTTEHFLSRIRPINDHLLNLVATVSAAAALVNMLNVRTAGVREAVRTQLKELARSIYDQFLELEAAMIQIDGAGIESALREELIAFHNAITEFVTGRDPNGEQLLQTSMIQQSGWIQLKERLGIITLGGQSVDIVGDYIGEQLQKLRDSGLKQPEAVEELRSRLKHERQYIPDHRLEFPKDQALDILLEPYKTNEERFRKLRQRYRDRQSKR